VTDLPTRSHQNIIAELRAFATGLPAYEAAIELLVAHGSHLRNPDFIDACVDTLDDGIHPPLTWIDWGVAAALAAAGDHPADDIVILAAELAGVDTGRSLGDLLAAAAAADGPAVTAALTHTIHGNERQDEGIDRRTDA
jgi:hypothetical protein